MGTIFSKVKASTVGAFVIAAIVLFFDLDLGTQGQVQQFVKAFEIAIAVFGAGYATKEKVGY